MGVSTRTARLAGALAIKPARFSWPFPSEGRTAGIGFPYAFAVVAFCGTDPLCPDLGVGQLLRVCPMALLAMCIATVVTVGETTGKDLAVMDRQPRQGDIGARGSLIGGRHAWDGLRA
ncbi:hypothetical protein DQ353_18105 [Arthrobacter sp. AQ5-05]|uniref:hypothetical protein n=1 Tax=Arthrobacter sp. AQ5-05 TaxID=2184581 RepID=UPI000DCD51A0|nr:hypothetical protein [Arthrobacter sp. AQ5-05]RAX47896.1 hypothetical protein DQ353_18105 [Arthrobacter sp. AQ5-05]